VLKVRALASEPAVPLIFPVRLAVIVFAAKFPLASLATIVLAPFADAAVVAEFGIFVSEAPEPEKVVAVITLAVKLPDASRETIVEAPLAEVAVVAEF
jgi:hypothetical protein